MNKNEAIQLLGGTPAKAAEALGYSSVQAIYMWPEELPIATSDRVMGAAIRTMNVLLATAKQDKKEVA